MPARVVVKVGTSALTDAQGRLDRPFLADLAGQIARQHAHNCEMLLVSSGAIRAGREALANAPSSSNRSAPSAPRPAPDTLPYKQAAAAIGQGRLMHTYTEAFAAHGLTCAQVLLTRDDLDDRGRFLNARNTLLALLALGVVPIINENDTVAVEEIKFGDNDRLAALVATLVDADLLLILSDVDGLYARPPDPQAALPPPVIPVVAEINDTILALAGGAVSGVGTGGMRSKVEAARIATQSGVRTIIARGRRANVLDDAIRPSPDNAAIGTAFLPRDSSDRLPARKRWIAHSARPRGSVTVNARAREQLARGGVSLLAVGIVSVAGTFAPGDLIEALDETGATFARGLSNYADSEVRRVLGLRSERFAEILGYSGFDEIIHCDNLVVA